MIETVYIYIYIYIMYILYISIYIIYIYIAPLTAVAPQEAPEAALEASGTFGSWSFSSAYREQRALCDDCALSYVSWTTSEVSAERNCWMTNCKSLSNH